MPKNIIALVDCNSFYCSCERVFRPDLWNKPIVVLSNGDGVIVSRTDEVKAMGLGQMSEPYFKIKDEFQRRGVYVFSSNYALYADMSRRVMKTLSEFTPELEVYSIDEAFLSLRGFENFENKDLMAYAKKIRETVLKHTGIPVSVGLGPTKVLAKAANQIAKKNKMKTGCIYSLLSLGQREIDLCQFPVQDLWGIGRQSSKKLNDYKIFNAAQLRDANELLIQKKLTIVGRRIQDELRGISCIDLKQAEADKKQIISSRSFDGYVTSKTHLQESIALHVSEAAIKLRKQNLITKCITVFIQTNPYSQVYKEQDFGSSSISLLSGSSHTGKLISYALKCLDQIYKSGFYYKKAGVIFHDLSKKMGSQTDFFNECDSDQEDQIMKILDRINDFHGKHTLKYAVLGTDKEWELKFKLKSPYYTTRWSDLLRV